jgi:hypothetical protein
MRPKPIPPMLFAIAGVVFFALHFLYFPTGVDYYFTFKPAFDAWMSGQPVFSPPYHGTSNAPWLLLFMIPLEWLTSKGAETALALLDISVIIAGWRLFSRNLFVWRRTHYAALFSLLFCLVNLHLFDLIFRVQIDVFILCSVMLLFVGIEHHNPYWIGVGWLMAGIRPTSFYLLLPFSLWMAYQHRIALRAVIVALVGFGASLLIFDPGWVGRWWTVIHVDPTQPGPWMVSLWHAAAMLQISPLVADGIAALVLIVTGWCLWRFRPNLRTTFALLVTASLVTTPYALSYHYSVLLVVFIPLLIAWRNWLMIPLYALTLTPLLRVPLGLDYAWLDILLPMLAWALILWKMCQSSPTQPPGTSRTDSF